jgi:hypothetical protein
MVSKSCQARARTLFVVTGSEGLRAWSKKKETSELVRKPIFLVSSTFLFTNYETVCVCVFSGTHITQFCWLLYLYLSNVLPDLNIKF